MLVTGNTVAMILLRHGHDLTDLMCRLDRAISRFLDYGEIVDQV
jgi:hypothetical protein